MILYGEKSHCVTWKKKKKTRWQCVYHTIYVDTFVSNNFFEI